MLTLRGEHFYFTENIGVNFQMGMLLAPLAAFAPSLAAVPGPPIPFQTPWRAGFRAETALWRRWRRPGRTVLEAAGITSGRVFRNVDCHGRLTNSRIDAKSVML